MHIHWDRVRPSLPQKKKRERVIKRRASLLLYRCVIYCLNNSLQGLELTGESKAATAQQPKTATVYQYIPATVGQPKVKEKIRVTTLEGHPVLDLYFSTCSSLSLTPIYSSHPPKTGYLALCLHSPGF